jgi:hypothetical protein
VEQVPPPSDADANTLVEAFLAARVDGAGADQYVHSHPDGWDHEESPVLYTTTGGSRYERYEFARLQGPVWPAGWIEYRIRLFAEDETTVEESFIVVRQEDGRLGLMYGVPMASERFPTTENGRPPVGALYSLLDGEVTFGVATPPWEAVDTGTDAPTFMTFALDRSSMMVMADPVPVDAACRPGATPADADELVQIIRSNPDVESAAPVAVRVAGLEALRLDVTFGPERGCRELGLGSRVVDGTRHLIGGVLRLLVVDLPEGMSARVVAIAIAAPDPVQRCEPGLTPCFDRVMEAATPTLDSLGLDVP